MRAIRSGSIEEKVERLKRLEARTQAPALEEYRKRLDMSWIHHDSAIEGIVYEPTELAAALSGKPVSDPTLAPVHDEIRQFQAAINLVRELAADPKAPIDLALIDKLHLTLDPSEPEPKYRKDMPLHRLYFHEISTPDKIAPKMKALVEWIDSDETQRTMHPTRIASRAHHTFLQIYPYPKNSGKISRLMMNLMLLRNGFPPAILHSTDRQRYYEAVRVSAEATASIIQEALENSVQSAIRYFQRLHGLKVDSY